VPVSHDFDFSGAVNARYAAPDPILPIRRVTERLYRGFCRPELEREWLAELFIARREAIRALYEGFDLLEEGDAKDVLGFYDGFFEILADDRRFDRQIVQKCRSWG